MKLRVRTLLYASFFLLSACGQRVIVGEGPTKTEPRQLSSTPFDKVEISAPVNARISIGGTASLSFDGYANIIPHLRTEIKDGTLRIYVDEITDISTDKNVIANITLPGLSGLDISGSGDAVVTGAVNAPDFSVDISGSGSVDIQELHVRNFDADLSGSANLTLRSGDIADGSFGVSGSGEIKAFGVSQQTASLDLSGSADAQVNVSSKLDIEISGAGSVMYKGHPSLSQDISGAGSIKDAN